MRKIPKSYNMIRNLAPIAILNTLDKFERNTINEWFGYLGRDNLSFNEGFKYSNNPRQKACRVGSIMGDMWEWELYKEFYKVLGNRITKIGNSNGDYLIDNDVWELRTGQGSYPQGNSYSLEKTPNFIIIMFKMDWEKKITNKRNNNKLITNIFAMITKLNSSWWEGLGKGDIKDGSSNLKIPNKDGIYNEIKNDVIYGYLDRYTEKRRQPSTYLRMLPEKIIY